MSEKEITALRDEVEKLREEIVVLRDCANKHFDLFTKHISDQGTDIADLFTYVMPLVHKAYPGVTVGQGQYEQALKITPKTDRPAPDNETP
jgi:hypothetical protein